MNTTRLAGWWKAVTALMLAAAALTECGGAVAAPPGSPWGADYFPNIALVNQDGKTLRFYDDMVKDKVVMINFMYSTCHDACPLETAKLRQVQEALGDRVGRDVFMYSISITPEHDTPAVLKEYAAKFKVGPGWQFLTGKEADITLLRKKLGLYDEGEQRSDHSMNMIVGNDATGQWKHRSTFDNPKVLARVVGDDLFNFSTPTSGEKSYADASKVIALDPGEDLFRRRCQVCHTVGAGDTLGPDLIGVAAKRDRKWLAHWIQAPNELLEAKDPIATALYAQFKQVTMPNLRLSDHDVEVLIGYLEAESQRVASMREAGGHDAHHQHMHQATADIATTHP